MIDSTDNHKGRHRHEQQATTAGHATAMPQDFCGEQQATTAGHAAAMPQDFCGVAVCKIKATPRNINSAYVAVVRYQAMCV